MPLDITALEDWLQCQLDTQRDPEKAPQMAAYMKTDMPFYGVQKPQRQVIFRQCKKLFVPSSQEDYEAAVAAIWALPHREEKYIAIDYACAFRKWRQLGALPLYQQMIQEGAWWDFVDPIASHLIGGLLMEEREAMTALLKEWIEAEDMWLRRTAILAHLRHKHNTDAALLFAHCLHCADETAFFIRKAIGWALREYSKSHPRAVQDFLVEHKERWSGLSFREGAKWLKKQGEWEEAPDA